MGAQQKEFLQELAPATIYHMTHIDNLASILEHGLYAHNNPYQQQDISNQTVNARRIRIETVHHRSVHEYVPLYFNPRNAMLYKTQKQFRNDIVILGFNSKILLEENTLYTNGNAAARATGFTNNLKYLYRINWNLVFQRSWYGYGVHVKNAMMAEVLVHQHLNLDMLQSINSSCLFTQRKIQTLAKKMLKKREQQAIDINTDHTLFFKNLL